MKTAAYQVSQAPPIGQNTKSLYPKIYRNEEGPKISPTRPFLPWEFLGEERLNEFPIKHIGEVQFNFERKPIKLSKLDVKIHHNVRERVVRTPPNDPGPFRAIVDQRGRLIGAVAHPKENKSGFERVALEPLTRQGREENYILKHYTMIRRSRM